MGVFNYISLKGTACPDCKYVSDWDVQFQYGYCRLIRYELDDTLRWEGYDVGNPSASIVLVEGIVEKACPNCHNDKIHARIFIDDSVIVSASLMTKGIVFPKDLDGSYIIIN